MPNDKVLAHQFLALFHGQLIPLVGLDEGIHEQELAAKYPHGGPFLAFVLVLIHVRRPAGHGQVGMGHLQVTPKLGAVELGL